MSEQKEADASSSDSSPSPAASASKLPLLLALVNILAVLGALGFLVYTKILYKRPAITEALERARLEKMKASPLPEAEPGFVDFPATTLNIAPEDRSRYATIGFSVQVRDKTRVNEVEAIRPLIMDKLLSLVGRLKLQDLTNVQGRYVLRSQLVDAMNEILRKNAGNLKAPASQAPKPEGGEGGGEGGEHAAAPAVAAPHAPIVGDLISDVFFTQFMVQ